MVKRNVIKSLGVEISELAFGAMRLPTLENGKINWEISEQMLDLAYQNGVNYFDTAYFYHGGESQEFLGETLKKYPRESYHFATKLPTWFVNSQERMEELFIEQLANCRMDYFDFYMMHGLGEDRYNIMVDHKIHEYLTEQKRLGKIKFLGFSYHGNYETFEKLLNNYPWDFAMIQINYVDDKLMDMGKFYDLMVEKNIPTMVMEPVRGGYLAKPPETVSKLMDDYTGEKYSPAAWALRWCRDKDNVATTLSGMSSMAQVEENIKIFSESPKKLNAPEHTLLTRARDIMLNIKTIPCTYCGYCMECPYGVDIPRVFETYNQFKLFPNEFRAGVGYGKLVRDGKGFETCINCGICSPQCPQKIDIPTALAQVHEELEPLRQKFIASV